MLTFIARDSASYVPIDEHHLKCLARDADNLYELLSHQFDADHDILNCNCWLCQAYTMAVVMHVFLDDALAYAQHKRQEMVDQPRAQSGEHVARMVCLRCHSTQWRTE